MNPTLYFLTKTENLIGQDWYYKRGLNYERFCVQIVLEIESNNHLAYEWNIMQEYTNCLIKDKMSYAMGVIKEFDRQIFFLYLFTEKTVQYDTRYHQSTKRFKIGRIFSQC
jgi:hypothetical protein